MMKRGLLIAAAVAAAAAAYAGAPDVLGPLERRTAAIAVFAGVLWASRAIPLFATSLVVVIASVLLLAEHGGLAARGDLDARLFLGEFGADIMMLFLGGLALSTALAKHQLDRAIATRLLRPLAGRPLVLLYAVTGTTAFLSMWMSNTATTAMMIAIVGSLLRGVPKGDRFGAGLILAIALGANVGGISTPIGTPPNAIALSALRDAGYEVTFLRWMIMATPLAALLLAIGGAVIYRLYAPEEARPQGELAAPELTPQSFATLAVLVAAIFAWLTGGVHGVSDGAIALGAAALLAALGLLDGEDLKSIEWPVLILMWGGLALGTAMEETGLVAHIGALPLAELPGLALAGIVVALGLGLSMFISNTATAAFLIPIVLALVVPEQGVLVVVTALACSFAMALPVSTPPNALTYGTGRIGIGDLARVGGIMGLIAILLMMAGYRVMVPWALPVGAP